MCINVERMVEVSFSERNQEWLCSECGKYHFLCHIPARSSVYTLCLVTLFCHALLLSQRKIRLVYIRCFDVHGL